jgi:hypothetical protein
MGLAAIPVIISFGTRSNIVCTIPTCTLFVSFKWKLKLLLRVSQVMGCVTVDNFVVRLQQVH